VAGNGVVDLQAGYRLSALGTLAELAVMVAASEVLHTELERISRRPSEEGFRASWIAQSSVSSKTTY
jgi:Na+-transporting NADH:ubiquinone oxidoreductase subunit NqrF